MIDRELLRTEYEKIWPHSPKMVDYCVNRVAEMAVLPTGEIIPIEKQRIATRFCFGESGYDYDDAMRMANHARTNQDYFKKENMSHFDNWIQEITGDNIMTITQSYRESERICSVQFMEPWQVVEAFGGCVNLRDIAGKTIMYRNVPHRIVTPEEKQIILDAYRKAREAHEKKVNSYLKRYGTSKVESWTYWRDA